MYGLPENGGTCPGASSDKGGCLNIRDGHLRQTCYMAKITQIYKAVGSVLLENTEILKDKTEDELYEVFKRTIIEFIRKSKPDELFFRLFYSGDLSSLDNAKAWARVIKEYPQVRFWQYTRSFDFIEPLLGIPNLSLYLSCDPTNYGKALIIFDKYKEDNKNLGLAWLGNGDIPIEGVKFVTCPETSGHIANTDDKGACAKCKLCINNYKTRIKSIRFIEH